MIVGYVQAQGCDPGPCTQHPGLVFDAENNECAWPDEVKCSLGGKEFVSEFT